PLLLHVTPEYYHALLRMTILGHLQFFLVGFLLADVYLTNWRKQPTVCWQWDVIGLAAWSLLLAALLTFVPFVRDSTGLIVLVAYIAAFRGPYMRQFFRWTPIVIIGGMCYTIYLYHWMGYFVFGRLTMLAYAPGRSYWVNYFVQLVTLVPITLIACT